jgi:thiamine-phosphate pyrophosphorylase
MDKLAILSNPKKFENEQEIIKRLFECGLKIFHLRKPDLSTREMKQYIQEIPAQYHNRIVIHSHYELALKLGLKGIHISKRRRKKRFYTWVRTFIFRLKRPDLHISTSFNNLSSLFEDTASYSYVFLSPVFDSISQSGYQGAFSHHNLKIALTKTRHQVLALGGINPNNIEKLTEMGFTGAVLSGFIWESNDPVEAFKACRAAFIAQTQLE